MDGESKKKEIDGGWQNTHEFSFPLSPFERIGKKKNE